MSNIDRAIIEETTDRIQGKMAHYRSMRNMRPAQILAKDPERLAIRASYAAPRGVTPTRLDLERILGNNDLLDVNYFERGLRVARSVGRIIFLGPGGQARGYATGFMVTPRLLLTNHHVFGREADAESAVIEFDYQLDGTGKPRPTERFNFKPEDFFYADEKHDCALVAVDPVPLLGKTRLADFGWLQLNPLLGKVNKGEYVSIIQHPGGQPKQIAIRENQLVDILMDPGIHLVYLSDTAQGSSGSPIFNDSWQVVGLHHSGVPKKDSQGRWLGKDGKPLDQNATEDQVHWIANEGVRISSIVHHIIKNANPGPLLDEFTASTQSAPGTWGESTFDSPPENGHRTLNQPTTQKTEDGMLITVPVSFKVQWLGIAPPEGQDPVPPPPVRPPAPPRPDLNLDEKKILDPDISNRDSKGYDPGFLSIRVPMPTLTPAAMKLVSRRLDKKTKDNHILTYYHYSIIMNARRRLCFFAASNYDASKKRRGQLSLKKLGEDKWDLDPRIPAGDQIKKAEMYDGTDYDLGHIVRREDNYWGQTEQEAVFANWDTFYYPNCSPQHLAFNRSGTRDADGEGGGIWGALEMSVANQLKAQDDRLTQFAGPVFSDTDKMFRQVVPVPKQYWKVVVAVHEGKLKSWGFLLSQARLIADIEADITVGEDFQPYHVPLAKIEAMTDVRFPTAVKAADVKARASAARAIERVESLEACRI